MNNLPPELQALGDEYKQNWYANLLAQQIPISKALLDDKNGAIVFALSDYFSRILQRRPQLLVDLFESGELTQNKEQALYQSQIQELIGNSRSEKDLAHRLRLYRQREMVRIIWRHFTHSASLVQTTLELSMVAEVIIRNSLIWLNAQWADSYGLSEEPPQMLVVALGKLGAQELNLSSDVDFMYVSPIETIQTIDNSTISYQQFYEKVAQRLNALLHEVTEEGFVFRVDLRLRPYGNSGPLVMSLDALENYYSEQGRDWERYALVKARAITGDAMYRQQLDELIRPFVYRRYIDFGAIDALREMHRLIQQEVEVQNVFDDIKRSSGGIREIEFIVQAFQLIRGGRESSLRERNLQKVIKTLTERSFLNKKVAEELTTAYIFLRDTEHSIQAFHDQQTHRLPHQERDKSRLAFAMGFSSWDEFYTELSRHRAMVEKEFTEFSAVPPAAAPEKASVELALTQNIWRGLLEQQEMQEQLQNVGCDDATAIIALIQQFLNSTKLVTLTGIGRQRIDALMPLVLQKIIQKKSSKETLSRIIDVISAILKRSAYLVLLLENPQALDWLVTLCEKSRMISNDLSQNPALLDELLNLQSIPHKAQLAKELHIIVEHENSNDLEMQMEMLRYFKQVNVLRVAAANVMGPLPLMRVSDRLTDIAEVILERVTQLAFEQLKKNNAFSDVPENSADLPFGIIAYGKLAGFELGYASDLDIVFIYDDKNNHTIEVEFYLRLSQRILHLLNTRTHMGILYHVDTQLRPLGHSGLLVSSLSFFEEYQNDQAWSWEHQALVRARMVVGTPQLRLKFNLLRRKILQKARDPQQLAREVSEMRDKMRIQKGSNLAKSWDLKAGRGGIIDIEFLVQYFVLRFAAQYPVLLRYPDNMRILDFLEATKLIVPHQAEMLRNAYCTLRDELHALNLQQLPGVVGVERFADLRNSVVEIWAEWLGDNGYVL